MRSLAGLLLCATFALGQPPADPAAPADKKAEAAGSQSGRPVPKKEYSNAARTLARNYHRPGWRLVDGVWVKPQGRYPLSDFVRLVEQDGRHKLIAQPAGHIEPMLRNWRTSLVELDESDYGWQLSCVGRAWNDTRSDGTQHLSLVAVLDDAAADQHFRLTKIDVKPHQQVVQAVVAEEGEALSVIIVFGRDFTEAAVGRFGARQPRILIRSGTARRLLVDHPIETRTYVLPVLRLLNGGLNPLAPAAGDVYRAFPDLPIDETVQQAISALVRDLASREPAVRERASRELGSLGRRGVQAAMKLDTTPLPPEAAERIESFIRQNTIDDREPSALRADAGFLLDCLHDPDPNVRTAAGRLVSERGK